MKEIVIYGAGGLGKEIASLIANINAINPTWNLLGFLDDDTSKTSWSDLPVMGNHSYLEDKPNCSVVIAVGNPAIKHKIVNKLDKNTLFPTLIHPKVILSDDSTINIGNGSIITAGCVLTCDIEIKDFVLLNLNSTVGHDVVIDRFSSIMCGVNIAGNVKLKEAVYVGSGANILNGITVGVNATVGAGAVVVKDVSSNITVVGVPAKTIGN